MSSYNNIKIIGNASTKNIVRTCDFCNHTFLLTCDDYIFNNCGCIIYGRIGGDGWVCKDCYDKIMKIKNI